MTHNGKETLEQIDHLIIHTSGPEQEFWQGVRQVFVFESGMMMTWQLVLEQGTVDGRILTRKDVQAIGQLMTKQRDLLAEIIVEVRDAYATR